MNIKIYMECGAPEAATDFENRIFNDIRRGRCPEWEYTEIAAPNESMKPVIFHRVSSGRYREDGDICFGTYIDGNILKITSGLLANWCATPSPEQQQADFGRLVSLLLRYRPYYKSLTIV